VIAEGKVFVYCNDYLVCLNEYTGAVLWNVSVEKTPDVCGSWVTPAYNNGNVFLSANKTYCFDAVDGGEVWSFAPPTGKGAVNGGCAIADGKVFTSDWDGGYYYCLDVARKHDLGLCGGWEGSINSRGIGCGRACFLWELHWNLRGRGSRLLRGYGDRS
jgi:outer membrane protein assembly factor BamB